MAIIKHFFTKQFGIGSNYHKLLKVEINSKDEYVELTVGVYVSEGAKAAGGNPIWHEYVRIPFSKLNFDPRDIFYPLLQEYEGSFLKDGTTYLASGDQPHPPVFQLVE